MSNGAVAENNFKKADVDLYQQACPLIVSQFE